MPKFRIEHDFLGSKQVPIDAYYGIQTLRAVENFPITGYRISEVLIQAFAMVKKSAALANMNMGHLNPIIGQPIVQAATEIIEGKLKDQFIVDPIQGGAGTSINMNVNEVIANRALEIMDEEKGNYEIVSPNSHVNMAQSTNDSFPTSTHLAVIRLLGNLLYTMGIMLDEFKKKARDFNRVIKMGRTHLQDAVPIRLGQEFAAYSHVIERDMQRIKESSHPLFYVNIGSTAVGTGLNADPHYTESVVKHLREISQLDIRHAGHSVDATQNTDAYTEVSSVLKICMINMSKIANDLRLMASGPRSGFHEIKLPSRQPGSSIMPGKVNPVMAEVINQVAFQVSGNDLSISLASAAGQLELNVMEPVLVFNLLQSINMMNNVFQSFTKYCLVGIEPYEDTMKSYVEKSIGIITAISPYLGYEISSKLAREALLSEKSIRQLCLEHHVLTREQLDIILDPYEMTNPGISGEKQLGYDTSKHK
ncbi:aspartate ammonia-lyase [Sporolactobacillus pectinivorans]|uniref:aspartate ammonia-lyase n=1 Tax=Sporolactobacillus pectinivorans TaxID=1591408 RepID=UPI000C25A3D2|nr:aspartate ammonia-lyase [Sporolactobacillus pectinivorans]